MATEGEGSNTIALKVDQKGPNQTAKAVFFHAYLGRAGHHSHPGKLLCTVLGNTGNWEFWDQMREGVQDVGFNLISCALH